ncbi:MAG: Gfo/Idh/MocA family oxidoreductase [Bacteroidota bacterium]
MPISPFFNHQPIRWGIIGCGNVTEVKSGPPYRFTRDFELAMVMRRDKEKAKDYAIRHGVPGYTSDPSEIIENPGIHAIYIATPPDTHKQYGLQVAQVGKPCCIEKPMAPTFADSLEIFNAFEERQVPLFIAYYRRSLPRFNKIKEWLDQERIGVIRHINWIKTRTPSPLDKSGAYNWRTDATIAPAGYFDDLASHGLDLFTYLLGNIEAAKGISYNQQGLYTALDAVSGSWIHQNGVTGSGVWNFGSYRALDQVVIYGEKGEIHFSVLDEAPLEIFDEKGKESVTVPHPKHLHEFHVENMRKQLFGEEEHPSTGVSGLHTSWVMDKILGVI